MTEKKNLLPYKSFCDYIRFMVLTWQYNKINFAEFAVARLLPFLLVLTSDKWLKTWINLTNFD